MATESDALHAATTLLAPLGSASLRGLTDDELLATLRDTEEVGRLIDRLRASTAAEFEHRSRRSLGTEGLSSRYGYPKAVHLLERMLRVSNAEATRRLKLGGALRHDTALTGDVLPPQWPSLAEKFDAGQIDAEAAATIVRCLSQVERTASIDDLRVAEKALVEHAVTEPAWFVSNMARILRDRLDPDGVLPREEEARARREIRLGRERNGVVPINGNLDALTAALMKSAFDEANHPAAQPRFLTEWDRINGTQTVIGDDGQEVTTVRDLRSRGQRNHDVLSGLLTAGVRNTGLENGQLRSTAEITGVILLKDLENGTGPGWIEGMTDPVSAVTIETLICDGGFRKALLGNDGEVLALGRKSRSASSAQQRAVIARDGGCIGDSCDAPPAWLHFHHVEEFWANGHRGNTDTINLVALCPAHHQEVHKGTFRIRMVNGVPQTLHPPGIDPTQTWRTAGKSKLRTHYRNTG